MIESISKPKLPSKYAYVLKTQQLQKILTDNNIDIHTSLVYCFPNDIASIFEAYFWPIRSNIPYNRLYIRICALPKENVFSAREQMELIVLPEFVTWITYILSLPKNSPQIRRELRFNAVFIDGNAKVSK